VNSGGKNPQTFVKCSRPTVPIKNNTDFSPPKLLLINNKNLLFIMVIFNGKSTNFLILSINRCVNVITNVCIKLTSKTID